MRPEVRDGFVAFTRRFEGYTDWMYLDVKGLVTIGFGNLVDPLPSALLLDYGSSTRDEVVAAWRLVKSRADMCQMGGGAFAKLTTVRATPESIFELVTRRLSTNEDVLAATFPCWDTWPWQAQLGCLSMAWAMGPFFTRKFPRFVAACRAHDWTTAAAECHMPDADNPGLTPRNRANEALFKDAAHEQAMGGAA